MKNGLYSIHVTMLDGHPDRGAGVMLLRDGEICGGNDSLSWAGSYTVSGRKWKGELLTSPHSLPPGVPRVFEDRDSSIGFSGTFEDERAEALGTALLGKASLRFNITLRWLTEA